MRRPTSKYGEPERTWLEHLLLRGGMLLIAAAGISALAGWTRRARAANDAAPADVSLVARHMGSLRDQLEDVRGELALLKLQLDRANTIVGNSAKYQIPADLAEAIYDIAISEGIEPSLGYQLVKIESDFRANARSPMRAIGYTQLQVATARFYRPGVTERDLLDRDTNLRLGFRFLNELLKKYDGDMHLALLAYNRGPARVEQIMAAGGDPKNGYPEAVLKGYQPTITTP